MSAKLEYRKAEILVLLDGEIDHHAASLLRVSIDNAVLRKRPRRPNWWQSRSRCFR